jgi:tetratricopeptide (TPR) repeat protein
MMARSRVAAGTAIGLLVAVLGGWIGWLLIGRWQVRDGLRWATRRMDAKQYALARERLAWLDRWWPGRADVAYFLGACEAELGHTDAALTAWRRVPSDTPLGAKSNLAAGRLLVRNAGRLTEAETCYRAAARGSSPTAVEARWALAEVLLWEGRFAEIRNLLHEIARARSLRDRIGALREHWRLDSVIVAAEEVQPFLDRADRTARDDPRVWLARAFLATRYGRFAEARDWLDRCQARNPDDPVLPRARLQWALAAGEVEEARAALASIPPETVDAAERWSLMSWFAARRGDSQAERSALENLSRIEIGNTVALDRLAALALQAGDTAGAAALRRRQEDALRDKERYRRLLIADRDPIPIDELHERARLAERLGRWFEARGWLSLVLERNPADRTARDRLDRLALRDRTPAPPGPPWSRLLADVGNTRHESKATTDDHAEHGPPSVAATPTGDRAIQHPPRASIAFRDDGQSAGLGFTYHNGESPQHQIPETIGGGVAVLDYDGDGWMDLYLVQGGAYPPPPEPIAAEPGDRLFRNRGDGTFEDATERAGIGRIGHGYGFGVASGDYDNDGRPDLFVTRFGSYLLLRNRGDGTFEDVTERSGLGGARDWPTSAAFADLDGDGDLDLYVCHYLTWDAIHPTLCPAPESSTRYVSCLPLGFPAKSDHLFRNDDGRFIDITASAGIVDRDGRGLGVVAADLDDDGRIDLFVANDMTANLLFHNRGDLRFEEIGHLAGVACNAQGGYLAGMGVACGDLDRDGRPDLSVTNFFGESTTFYRNLGQMMFADATSAVGLKAPSRFLLGFGISFVDVDNDGSLDLATANGHIHDVRPNVPYAMPAQLLTGDRQGRLTDVTDRLGPPWTVPRIGRGLARADLDNDGRIDIILIAQNSPLAYFHNQTEHAGHFLTIRLEGTRSNRDAIGAKVTVTADGQQQTAWRVGGGSYASAEDPRLHFGVGASGKIEEVEVRWPSGRVDHYRDLPADADYLIREGETKASALKGFATPRAGS